VPFNNGGGNLSWFQTVTTHTNNTTTSNFTLTTTPPLGTWPAGNDALIVVHTANVSGPGTVDCPLATVTDNLGNTLILGVDYADSFSSTAGRTQINWVRIPGGINLATYTVSANINGGPTGAIFYLVVEIFNSTTAISSSIQVDSTAAVSNIGVHAIPFASDTYTPVVSTDINDWAFATQLNLAQPGGIIANMAGQPPAAQWNSFTFSTPSVISFMDTNTQQILGIGAPGSYQASYNNQSGAPGDYIGCSLTFTRY